MNDPVPAAFDTRLFWRLFALAAALPLIALAGLLLPFSQNGAGIAVALSAAGLALLLYAVLLLASIVLLLQGRSGKGLAVLAALAAGVIVGPGLCFGLGGLLG